MDLCQSDLCDASQATSFPTRQELDEAAPEHPVCFRTGPDAAFNSLALKLNQVDRDTQVPDGKAAKIERDAQTVNRRG